MLAWLIMLIVRKRSHTNMSFSVTKRTIMILMNTTVDLVSYLRDPKYIWKTRLAENIAADDGSEDGSGGQIEGLFLPFPEIPQPSLKKSNKKGILNAPRAVSKKK